MKTSCKCGFPPPDRGLHQYCLMVWIRFMPAADAQSGACVMRCSALVGSSCFFPVTSWQAIYDGSLVVQIVKKI